MRIKFISIDRLVIEADGDHEKLLLDNFFIARQIILKEASLCSAVDHTNEYVLQSREHKKDG